MLEAPTRYRLAVLLLVSLLLGRVPAIGAATFTVTTTADGNDGTCDADCSLREAVIAANAAAGADEIVVPAGTYVLTGAGNEDAAASGDLDVRESVTISGAGTALTILDGNGVDRLIDIVDSATVTLRDLTLQHGHVAAGDTQGGGAVLFNEPFTGKTLDLRLERVAVLANHAGDGDGGGILIEEDGGTTAAVTITDSTIAGNTMLDGDGGGLHLCCEFLTTTIAHTTITGNTAVEDPNVPGTNGEGGGIYHCCNDTTLTITDSTLSDNVGPTQGGGLYTCCGTELGTLATIERTTISGNTALGPATNQGNGGGIEGEGAVALINSTLSGNRARKDGGGIDNEDYLVMRSVTIADNEGGRGGGFYEDGLATTLENTIFAGNVVPPSTPSNCGVAIGTDSFVSGGGNLSSDTTCVLAVGGGDRVGVDPLLLPLADNGGPNLTHALAVGSPAIDGGNDGNCQPLDQRGHVRPADGDNDGNASCDSGALEVAAATENCTNGLDDNGNGLIDCDDLACAGIPTCHERCDNCVDDDGDGLVDRDDVGDCFERSDSETGVGDPMRSKLLVRCAGTLQKAGAKITAAHVKTLQACLAQLSTCVQRKPGDAACLTTASASCRQMLADLAGVDEKARARILSGCDRVTTDDIRKAPGLGFLGEIPFCAELGVSAIDTIADVAACVRAQHACTAERLVAVETPRARELLVLAGLDANTILACATPTAGGGSAGLAERGKAIDACQRTIQKRGAKLVAGLTALAARCANTVFACRQRKPGDERCLARARVSCPRLADRMAALESKLVATITKKCGKAPLTMADLLNDKGAGFLWQADLCKALGVPTLATTDAIGECVAREHRCRADQLLERELPRLRELLSTGGITLP